jgi:hypothetical protein
VNIETKDAVTFDVSAEQAQKIENSAEAKNVRLDVRANNGKLVVSTGLRCGPDVFVAVNAPFKTALKA